MELTTNTFIDIAKKVIELETKAITALLTRINNNFSIACQTMLDCSQRIIVMGMGKSGHIGRKIAATFASTGTPAFFVHPAEAGHGDMGMITAKDVLLVLSNSGETEEILRLLPMIKRTGIPLISMTGNPQSSLAKQALVNLDISVQEEACPLGLAPTSSTTVSLVMGDALAIALLQARGFSQTDFAFSHPSGNLGKRLLLTVEKIMHTGADIPSIQATANLQAALLEMTRTRLGITAIINEQNQILGIFTDGDLRRAFNQELALSTPISSIMTPTPTIVMPTILAAEALRIMEAKKINSLLVKNNENQLIGALNMHDLLQAGIL